MARRRAVRGVGLLVKVALTCCVLGLVWVCAVKRVPLMVDHVSLGTSGARVDMFVRTLFALCALTWLALLGTSFPRSHLAAFSTVTAAGWGVFAVLQSGLVAYCSWSTGIVPTRQVVIALDLYGLAALGVVLLRHATGAPPRRLTPAGAGPPRPDAA